MKPNSITITYLSKVSMASLNGGDKEVDNINPLKKVTLNNGEELPYVSSQAIRRALRDKITELGNPASPVEESSTSKGAPKTALDPAKYIDDDLFGYMDATNKKDKDATAPPIRTSPIRVESLLALATYKGDLDYATNFTGKKIGLNPNIFETEIHSGVYRGTILIELDRVGRDTIPVAEKNKPNTYKELEYVDNKEKARRVVAFIDAFRTMWSQGRQTRFLADISPKFVAAAYMKSKNPVFLEAVDLTASGQIEFGKLQSVVEDYDKYIEKHSFGVQEAVFDKQEGMTGLKGTFEQVEAWIADYYGQN